MFLLRFAWGGYQSILIPSGFADRLFDDVLMVGTTGGRQYATRLQERALTSLQV